MDAKGESDVCVRDQLCRPGPGRAAGGRRVWRMALPQSPRVERQLLYHSATTSHPNNEHRDAGAGGSHDTGNNHRYRPWTRRPWAALLAGRGGCVFCDARLDHPVPKPAYQRNRDDLESRSPAAELDCAPRSLVEVAPRSFGDRASGTVPPYRCDAEAWLA